jgi:uncharacterized protein with von Willebrand factor type A (vWA) domain
VLSATELGLWAMSTFMDEFLMIWDWILLDDRGAGSLFRGAGDKQKLTLIVDTSGSLMGKKIIQAKNAASTL